MGVVITDNYLTPVEYSNEGTTIFARVQFYDTELSGTPNDGRLIAELTGVVTGGSFTFTNESDMMSSGSLSMIVDEEWIPILSVKRLSQWFRGVIKVIKIYHDNNDGGDIEIPWGVYTVESNAWSYNESSYTLSMTLQDCMDSLTADKGNTIIGRAGGHNAPTWAFNQFEMIRIEAGVDIDKTIREFTINYAPFAYDVNISMGTAELAFPYEMEFDSSVGLYECLEEIKNVNSGMKMFFDMNGVFNFKQVRMRWEEPCHILGSHIANLVISEERTISIGDYRNSVAVWGGTVEVKDDSNKTETSANDEAVGKYFGVATDYSDAIVGDTRCEVISNEKLSSNDFCRQAAEYQLYLKNRLTETLTVTIIDRCLPMYYQLSNAVLGIGEKIEYTSVITGETDLYILSELNNDLVSRTVTLSLNKFYEFYPDEAKIYADNFDGITFEYTLTDNVLHIDFIGDDNKALFKIYMDNAFLAETCTDDITLTIDEGTHYFDIIAYNPMIKPARIGGFSIKVGEAETFNILAEDDSYILTEQNEFIIQEEVK